ncbi:putative short-chain dehydrogenase/reductase SDR, NAD(P)-binding domain superfamily [Helianthus annuus]|nr:putative short-chain dehydrogenase/reductase SDR, NAD(P)-binding domain superfamily [Helianthus annuus]
MASKRIAVVTGGNKGIGFEICKQLLASSSHDVLVVVTARDEQKGLQALHKLKTLGLSENTFVFRQLDVTDPSSITSFADFIGTQFGKLDILVRVYGRKFKIFVSHDENHAGYESFDR